MEKKVGKSFCSRLDDGGCGLQVILEAGRVKKIEGDPECAISRGFICRRAAALKELLYHPDRLTYPRIRTGGRGAGSWKRVSWDEALNYAARKLTDIITESGAKSVCLASGSPKGLEVFFMHRLASLLGTPNVSTPGNVCHMPREIAQTFTYGGPSYPDLENLPKAILLWGVNPYVTNAGGPGAAAWLRRAIGSGVKTAVIDPRKTEVASRAHLWVRLRPGSDAALALGCLKVIVEEELYDRDFVARWTLGWAELQKHIEQISLEQAARAAWLTPEQIRELARFYATNSPAVLLQGNALDHTPHSFQSSRALAILRAITGNIDRAGGDILPALPNIKRPGEFALLTRRGDIQKAMVGAEFKLAQRNLFVPRQLITEAILEGRPYPLRALLLFGTNPMLTFPDSQRVYDALMLVEFLAVSDIFMTPTAELADLVLPAAAPLEANEIGYFGTRYGTVVARCRVAEPAGECWADIEIINELGKRLGFAEHFWQDTEAAMDEILKPAGLSFNELAEKGFIRGGKRYSEYEQAGFRTPSGKVELYSQQLKDMGYAPLPPYSEPPESADYPLVLSSRKSPYFFHSAYRHIKSLRKLAPQPKVEVHPETAAGLGLKDGDWAYIESTMGKIKQRVKYNSDLDRRVIYADFGWWFPERGREELYGWRESNVNVLTEGSPAEPAVGSTYLRSIPCRLKKCDATQV